MTLWFHDMYAPLRLFVRSCVLCRVLGLIEGWTKAYGKLPDYL